MDDQSWTNIFFPHWQPPDWINSVHGKNQHFKPFPDLQRNWILGRLVARGRRASQDRTQVLWLLVRFEKRYTRKCVAKVFPDYTATDAQSQLRRLPSRIPRKLMDVRDALDPYLNDARAFQRIGISCPASQRIYFPAFYGVITDLSASKFTSGYVNS
ncbi:uncharacterized protein BP01DRAFT_112882 [Aspergillus saccharolyticus JOP 1030-1]|uniref:Uncharacterized protein n=1 Tax=Aspergillus saccharolyticus JOP 1030-1 TaxID=1450539 RepID=A0A318ZWV8_9EURO|nr:hypothetical protein BP01DRAFT_112882 [Aspergillus saccharolyticus JOP 1030-1]PYH48803.1 hypothetical protein BP01DRAFT_112882 [Aspergillus saccharolyticus JOP 1030-1]